MPFRRLSLTRGAVQLQRLKLKECDQSLLLFRRQTKAEFVSFDRACFSTDRRRQLPHWRPGGRELALDRTGSWRPSARRAFPREQFSERFARRCACGAVDSPAQATATVACLYTPGLATALRRCAGLPGSSR